MSNTKKYKVVSMIGPTAEASQPLVKVAADITGNPINFLCGLKSDMDKVPVKNGQILFSLNTNSTGSALENGSIFLDSNGKRLGMFSANAKNDGNGNEITTSYVASVDFESKSDKLLLNTNNGINAPMDQVTVPAASSTASGIITAGAQEIGGEKTLSSLLKAHGGISLDSSTEHNVAPTYLLGIKGFAEGGNIVWDTASSVKVGYANEAEKAIALKNPQTIGITGAAYAAPTLFDGTYDIDLEITKVKEAYLSWGGKNHVADYGPIDAAMIGELGANRFAFLRAAGITIEYSRDAGKTWTTSDTSDYYKTALFSNGCGFTIGNSDSTNKATKDCLLRITINTDKANLYTFLNKFCIYCSTSGSSGSYCSIDIALEESPTVYKNIVNKQSISGWSGYNIINIGGFTTYGNTPSYQYGRIRFTFGCEKHESSYNGLSISRIMGFGGVGWSTPSNMASTGHLYSYDGNQNAIFPANVTATSFIENGSNLSDKYLALSGGTMKGAINLPYNEKSLEFSRGEYSSGIFYGTSGNENLAFINEWRDASFSFVTNSNPDSWTSSTWHASTTIPDLQIKKKSVYINKLIGNGVNPEYNLYVNGTSYFADNLKMANDKGIVFKFSSGKDFPLLTLDGYSNFGIRYKEGSPDTLKLSASGNANTDKADLCINGNGEGTVTIRGNTILHAGNYDSYAIKKTEKGSANGVASLDGDVRLPSSQLTIHNHDDRYYTESEIDTKISKTTKYIDLSSQCQKQSYRKSVIGLCELKGANTSHNSYSIGRVTFHRINGLSGAYFTDIAIEDQYSGDMIANASFSAVDPEKIRPCTFTYNGKTYGGIEFFFNDAEHNYVEFFGNTNFDIFALDYYDTQKKQALNNEVYNSLNFSDKINLTASFSFNGNKLVSAKHENGYYGLALSDGSDPGYFRTPKNGLIPWSSSNGGYLGTSGWQFSEGYIKNIHSTSVTATTFTGALKGTADNANTVDGWHVEYENGYTSVDPTYICGFDTSNKKIKCAQNGLVNGSLSADYFIAKNNQGLRVKNSNGSPIEIIYLNTSNQTVLPNADVIVSNNLTASSDLKVNKKLKLQYDTTSIDFRGTGADSGYGATAFYGTSGNEALTFATKQGVTSFIFATGYDTTGWSNASWNTIAPTLQIKNKSVYINELISNDTTPAYNFSVKGTANITGDLTTNSVSCNDNYILHPEGGSYRTTSSVKTGMLMITLPSTNSNTMLRFNVEIYDYKTFESTTYTVGGYNYSSGWHSTFAYCNSHYKSDKRNLNVRFGENGGKDVVYIGEPDTRWNYPQISISNVSIGYSGATLSKWNKDWSIDFITTAVSELTIDSTHINTNVAIKSKMMEYANATAAGYRNVWMSNIDDSTQLTQSTSLQFDVSNGRLKTTEVSLSEKVILTYENSGANIGHFGFRIL